MSNQFDVITRETFLKEVQNEEIAKKLCYRIFAIFPTQLNDFIIKLVSLVFCLVFSLVFCKASCDVCIHIGFIVN